MRWFWSWLPGPMPAKVIQLLVLIVLGLVGLFFLFEWAGNFLDSGGVIGG